MVEILRLSPSRVRPYLQTQVLTTQMKEISVMQKSMVLSCLATLVGSGCISAARPPMVATATGERLEVVDDVVKWTTQEKVQVGEVEFTDDKGKSEGKAKVYENQQKQHSVNIWYPVQGTQALSDEEFFQIAGDTSALDRTLKLRSEGEQRQTTGHYLIGGGAQLRCQHQRWIVRDDGRWRWHQWWLLLFDARRSHDEQRYPRSRTSRCSPCSAGLQCSQWAYGGGFGNFLAS
jgi:hypothetical protein